MAFKNNRNYLIIQLSRDCLYLFHVTLPHTKDHLLTSTANHRTMTSKIDATTAKFVSKTAPTVPTNAPEPVSEPITTVSEPIPQESATSEATTKTLKDTPKSTETQDTITKKESLGTGEPTHNDVTSAGSDRHDLLSQLESKVSSFWTKATDGNSPREGLGELKQDILTQIASAKESLAANELLQTNVTFAENKLKELTERVKSTDVGSTFDAVSTRANQALDTLDSQLEIVEKQASKFVSLLTSFFSSMVVVKEEPQAATVTAEVPKTDRAFSRILTSAYGNTRFENDLHKLHTTESFYLEGSADEEKRLATFDVSSKTTDISKLLAKYPDTLQSLINRLVPEKIRYDVFWYRYFEQELQLKQQEESRKKLLKKPEGNISDAQPVKTGGDEDEDDDDDDFTWDDDE